VVRRGNFGLVVLVSELERVGDIAQFLDRPFDDAACAALRHAETIGRPVGMADWLNAMQKKTGRALAPAKHGKKLKQTGLQ